MKKYNGKELYKGLLFIKSMMSMNNVNRQKELDQTYALSVGIECDQTVVDDGASTSVDRPQMRQLMDILEISDYKVLVVEDIYEITRNPEDLKSMMDRINDLGVTIFDLGTMSARYSYIVFASETVVFDDYGKPVIKCPTEAEAVEYIMNRLESEVIQDDI